MPEGLLFGIRPLLETIESGRSVDKVLIKKGLTSELFRELKEKLNDGQIPFQVVPPDHFRPYDRWNHQGVIAFLAATDFLKVEEYIPALMEQKKNPLLIILDKVSDVRNFGAIVRTAECAGVDAIIIPEKGSAAINADALKTSAGALNHIAICRSQSLFNTLIFLKECGIQLIAASEKTNNLYYQADFSGPSAIISGSEDHGIAKEFLKLSDKIVKIPMQGKIGSLNVSVATAILIYEAIRQRNL